MVARFALRFLGGAALVALAAAVQISQGITRHVPAEFPTIQEAVNRSRTGDTVLVAPGIYMGIGNTAISFYGIDLILRSSAGATQTTIDGEGSSAGIRMHFGETRRATIEGFTIRGGDSGSGGIICEGAGGSPTIRDCRITGGVRYGVNVVAGVPNLIGCEIVDNASGGVCVKTGIVMTDCSIARNNPGGVGWGGGILLIGGGSSFINCTISENHAEFGGGVAIRGRSTGANFDHCSITGNVATDGGGIYRETSYQYSTFSGCTISSNTASPRGGAIFEQIFPHTLIMGCFLRGNTALQGGAAYGNWPQLSSCLIAGNLALESGGGVYGSDGASIGGCTISGNRAAGGRGGGIWCSGQSSLGSTILHGNCSASDGPEMYTEPVPYSGASFSCSLVDSSGVGGRAYYDEWTCLFGEPIFTDPRGCGEAPTIEGGYSQLALSPCTPCTCFPLGAIPNPTCEHCGPAVRTMTWGRLKALYR